MKMYYDNSTNLNSGDIPIISLMSITLLFCFNTLVVLVYFIRRRVRLGLEIRRIPADQMVRQEYKNYFMNLKTTIKITNFIILILIIELLENLLFIQVELRLFVSEQSPSFIVNYLIKTYQYVLSLLLAMRFMYVPLLSLVMNFLWHVYRKYEYKYTLIRWIAYIIVRCLVVILYINVIPIKIRFFFTCFYIFDFIQYVYYSKRFYSHLKSREKEIRLFYFDKEAYLNSRWIRIHFFVGNVLVTSALFLSTLGYSMYAILKVTNGIVCLFDYEGSSILEYVLSTLDGGVVVPILIVHKVLYNFYYLYIIIVIFYKSIRSRIKLYNINKHIKPIVEAYHSSMYNQYR